MAKKAVNLSIDAELLARAKAARLNLSALLEQALSEQVRAEQERRWRHGVFGEDYRSF